MSVPTGHWLILMTISQLKVINRSEVIKGLQMQEANVIKDASVCQLSRKCLFLMSLLSSPFLTPRSVCIPGFNIEDN